MIPLTLILGITDKNLFYYYVLITLILSITALSTHCLVSELSKVYLDLYFFSVSQLLFNIEYFQKLLWISYLLVTYSQVQAKATTLFTAFIAFLLTISKQAQLLTITLSENTVPNITIILDTVILLATAKIVISITQIFKIALLFTRTVSITQSMLSKIPILESRNLTIKVIAQQI